MRGFIRNAVQEALPNEFFRGQPTAYAYLQKFFNHVSTMPDVRLAMLYSRDGKVLWSTNHLQRLGCDA
jgi:hypothetical protein